MAYIVKAVSLALMLTVSADEISHEISDDNESPSGFDYHRRIGIPRATEIKKWEDENAGSLDGLRIIGGWHVDISEVPYQAGLIIPINNSFISVCGASLYSHNRLVTAAHCINDGRTTVNSLTVVLGSNYIFSDGLRFTTSELIVHPNYTPGPLLIADIAIIRIPSVRFSNTIQPVDLPMNYEIFMDYIGWIATASGFGLTTSNGGDIPDTQRISAVEMPVISNDVCSRFFEIYDDNICTTFALGKGPCLGDSGGPLVVTSNNRRILIGITSFGEKQCKSGAPPVYTRVTSFIHWIRSQ